MTLTNELIEFDPLDAYETFVRFDGTIVVPKVELDQFKKEFMELIEKYRI